MKAISQSETTEYTMIQSEQQSTKYVFLIGLANQPIEIAADSNGQ
jgi:hypothetical protein